MRSQRDAIRAASVNGSSAIAPAARPAANECVQMTRAGAPPGVRKGLVGRSAEQPFAGLPG